MNALLSYFGLSAWKPLLTALLLPPTPWLMLLALGLIRSWRRPAWSRLTCGVAGVLVWMSGCSAVAEFLDDHLLPYRPPLSSGQIAGMGSLANKAVAIIVLGGGVEDWAPEYGSSSLAPRSLERLRYGLWLARRTGWPIGFSGGVGWAQPAAIEQNVSKPVAEAAVAQRLATQEWGQPLRWTEVDSRDTLENATNTIAILKPQGIRHIVLVTDSWHMPRAIRDFELAAGPSFQIEAAPIGLARGQERTFLRWLPSGDGFVFTRQVVRERLGLWFGS